MYEINSVKQFQRFWMNFNIKIDFSKFLENKISSKNWVLGILQCDFIKFLLKLLSSMMCTVFQLYPTYKRNWDLANFFRERLLKSFELSPIPEDFLDSHNTEFHFQSLNDIYWWVAFSSSHINTVTELSIVENLLRESEKLLLIKKNPAKIF